MGSAGGSIYTINVRTDAAVSNMAYDGQNLMLNVEKPQDGNKWEPLIKKASSIYHS